MESTTETKRTVQKDTLTTGAILTTDQTGHVDAERAGGTAVRHRSGPTKGRQYPRTANNWIPARDAAMKRAGDNCEITGLPLKVMYAQTGPRPADTKTFWKWLRAVDHVIPERACRKMFPGCNPHVAENLVCIASSLHARKTKMEWRMYRGDWLGYLAELRRLGFEPQMVKAALRAVSESVGACRSLK